MPGVSGKEGGGGGLSCTCNGPSQGWSGICVCIALSMARSLTLSCQRFQRPRALIDADLGAGQTRRERCLEWFALRGSYQMGWSWLVVFAIIWDRIQILGCAMFSMMGVPA